MPTYAPTVDLFWDFLMQDDTYRNMLTKESATGRKADFIPETKEQIFSKFANLDTGSINYDDLDSFLGLFSSNFPEAYEKHVADVPRNERKQAKEKIFERFSKVLEFDIGRQKKGRPKLDFEGQVAKFINSKNPNLDEFYKILMKKYNNYSMSKKNKIDRVKKDIGSKNLRKIIAIFKENTGDIKEDKKKGPQAVSTLKDFDNPKKMQFNIMKLIIGIGTFGVKLPKNIAGFTKTSDNNQYLTSSNESFSTYEKLVPIEGFDLEAHKKPWIKGMSKYIYTHTTTKKEVRRTWPKKLDFADGKRTPRSASKEERTVLQEELRFKDDDIAKKYKLKIVYFEDMPLLREILDKKDKKVIETINFDVGEELSFESADINENTIEKYFELVEGSRKAKVSNLKDYFSFKLGPPSKDSQKLQLYEATSGHKRLYYHPTLKNLFSSSSGDAFSVAVERITEKTATAYKGRIDESDKVSGVEQYDTEDIEDIFDSENLLTYPKLYAPFMDGGKLNIYPQEEYDTPEQKLNAGLVRMADKDKLRTSNKKIISFVNAMLKYAFDENDVFDEDELSDNEEIIAGEIETEVTFSKPSEKAFFEYLLSKKKTKDIKDELIPTGGDLTNYFGRRLTTREGFAYLFSIAHLYLDDEGLKNKLEELLEGKNQFSKKSLSTKDKSLISEIASEVEKNLIKIRTAFKDKLKKMLDEKAQNPKSIPKSLLNRLTDKQLLEIKGE